MREPSRATIRLPQLVYVFDATVNEINPPIWRRFVVPSTITLEQLHWVLLALMGWSGAHLWQFERPGKGCWGDPELLAEAFLEDEITGDARRTRLMDVISRKGSKLLYNYDFGDDWWITLRLAEHRNRQPGEVVPAVLDGSRNGPPEDVGGPWGYQNLLEAIRDPNHPEHAELREWVGEGWDPEAFDRERLQAEVEQAIGGPPWMI